MAATGRALEVGFDTQAWQLAWALSKFLDMRGRWHDWAVTEQIALAATQRLGDREARPPPTSDSATPAPESAATRMPTPIWGSR